MVIRTREVYGAIQLSSCSISSILESIKAFVILKKGVEPTEHLKEESKQHVKLILGAIAVPDELEFVEKLPKTSSGKIMRRVLKALELGLPVGDISTLED